MATATKKKPAKKSGKARRRVVASRAAKPSTNGKAKKAGQSGKFAPNQPAIKGLEDTDERIAALDELCAAYVADDEKRKIAKVDRDTTAGKIMEVIKEKKLDLYIYQGKKFYVEPGAEGLKVVVVKQGQ
jgi:hypothetical protein